MEGLRSLHFMSLGLNIMDSHQSCTSHHQLINEQNHLRAIHVCNDIKRMESNTRALNSHSVDSQDSFAPLLLAMGIDKTIEYSTESKMSLLDVFSKGMIIAGKLLTTYFEQLEDQLTEMTVATTNMLDQYDEHLWKFTQLPSDSLMDAKVTIRDIPLQSIVYLKSKPVSDIPRLLHESRLIIDLTNELTGNMYERISDIDNKSSKTSDVLSMMRLMKTVDTSRTYLGNRRIEVNFNHAEALKISWDRLPTSTRNVEYTVDLESFKGMLAITRLIVRTVKTTKETLKLSKTQYGVGNTPIIRDSVINQLYVPLLLDLVKLKDVYMLMMSKYVAQNKGFIK